MVARFGAPPNPACILSMQFLHIPWSRCSAAFRSRFHSAE